MGLKLKGNKCFKSTEAIQGSFYKVIDSVMPDQLGNIVMRTFTAKGIGDVRDCITFTDLENGATWDTFPTWTLLELDKKEAMDVLRKQRGKTIHAKFAKKGKIYKVVDSPAPSDTGKIVVRNSDTRVIGPEACFTCISNGDTYLTTPDWMLIELEKGTTLTID